MQDELNPQQYQAVTHMGTACMVLAGAGSGKTRVITYKLRHLIENVGIPAHKIAAITFTNKAAREMKSRALDTIAKGKTKGLIVSTFHNLGLRILKQHLSALGYRQGVTILDADDSLGVIRQILSHRDETIDKALLQGIRNRISRWKNDFVNPGQAQASAADDEAHLAARVYAQYQTQIKSYNAFDFDDLIVLPVQLFSERADVLEQWQNRIHYLLVDEYQDTNVCQYKLIQQLVGVRKALTAVGDDDQSIYAWRGAQADNIDRLSEDFAPLTVIKLEQNYRSTQRIIDAANSLIKHNPHKYDKALWSDLGEGERVEVIACRNEEQEADQIISRILKHHYQDAAQYGEMAILYRSNYQSRIFEQALRAQGIAYNISGAKSFFDAAEIKDLSAYLRLIINPEDDSALLRVVNVPKRKIGNSTLAKLGDYAAMRQCPMLHAIDELGLKQSLDAKAIARLQQFKLLIDQLSSEYEAEALNPVEVLSQIIERTGYYDWLVQISNDSKGVKRREANIEELKNWMHQLYRGGEGKQSLVEILNHMALVDMLENKDDDEQKLSAVHLMTLHASKGLEFPYVMLAGFEEGLIPHTNHLDDDFGLQEERRLAYVGITRAQKALTILVANSRMRGGQREGCEPSRFLEEIGEQHLQWSGQTEKSSSDRKQNTASNIDQLLNMIGED